MKTSDRIMNALGAVVPMALVAAFAGLCVWAYLPERVPPDRRDLRPGERGMLIGTDREVSLYQIDTGEGLPGWTPPTFPPTIRVAVGSPVEIQDIEPAREHGTHRILVLDGPEKGIIAWAERHQIRPTK